MADNPATQTLPDTGKRNSNPVWTYSLRIVVAWLAVSLLVFGGAGRLDWLMGWVFSALWIVPKLAWIWLILRRDPGLAAERVDDHANTQPWDRTILRIYGVFAFGSILVASLDQRWGWSGEVPAALVIAAVILYLAANLLVGWITHVNTFFSSVARIQTDRGQVVVDQGPYAIVRHPTYSLTVILWLTTPLILESWWGIVPGALAALMMILRTRLEDRMLRAELPGYAEYARRVRYRLLPGVW